jgi:cytochrome c556
MKTRSLLIACAIALTAAGLNGLFAQSKRQRAAKEFMRDKLELSQKVLEGLATEDYDLITAKATKLSAMTQEADWRVFENPDYDQHSATFRRHADALVRSAKNKNLDGATLAYVRLTMSCVDCHKYVRGRIVARANIETAPAFASAWNQGY